MNCTRCKAETDTAYSLDIDLPDIPVCPACEDGIFLALFVSATDPKLAATLLKTPKRKRKRRRLTNYSPRRLPKSKPMRCGAWPKPSKRPCRCLKP